MAFRLSRSDRIGLDSSPEGEEEYEAWTNIGLLTKKWDPDAARIRIDAISRRLARYWSMFLAYIILAQGKQTGFHIAIKGVNLPLLPAFHLQPSEFIAVVTTTTASVFGFLIIVSKALFDKDNVELDKS